MGAGNIQPPRAGLSSHPFRFVPVLPELAVTDTPVWHDSIARADAGRGDDEELLSGELRCELVAKTPLHVGWKQTKTTIQGTECMVSEPLTLAPSNGVEPGPVVIPGSTLNGMLRHSIGALLCAPMERVAERTFSYRPNSAFADRHATVRLACVPALVIEGPDCNWTPDDTIRVAIFERMTDVALVPESRRKELLGCAAISESDYFARKPLLPMEFLPNSELLNSRIALRNPDRENSTLSVLTSNTAADLSPWKLAYYQCGSDGEGLLARKFDRHFDPKACALIKKTAVIACRLALPHDALANLKGTVDHLADDDSGHLRDHPNVDRKKDAPKIAAAVRRRSQHLLTPGTLIFLEVTAKPPANLTGSDVKAILPIFRGRVRYTDTVHTRVRDGRVEPRPELMPIADELQQERVDGKWVATRALSAARLLFGLNAEGGVWPESLAKSHFGRVSGRVGCNAAVEVIEHNRQRFEVSSPGHPKWVFALRPQGSPKPSAVEHYVAQDAHALRGRTDCGTLVTWGDGDQPGGELAGRKFYLHQADINENMACVEADRGELHDSGQHCPRLKWLSTTGTQFRFTVRFHNLRPWELGALLLAVEPTAEGVRTVEFGVLNQSGPVANNFDKQRGDRSVPTMAHKLGRGRAYGLGSAAIRIDAILRIDRVDGPNSLPLLTPQVTDDLMRRTVAALGRKIAQDLGSPEKRKQWVNRVLRNWVDVQLWRRRRTPGYPALNDRPSQSSGDTIEYHNKVRGLHIKGRKAKAPHNRPTDNTGQPIRYGILPDPDW